MAESTSTPSFPHLNHSLTKTSLCSTLQCKMKNACLKELGDELPNFVKFRLMIGSFAWVEVEVRRCFPQHDFHCKTQLFQSKLSILGRKSKSQGGGGIFPFNNFSILFSLIVFLLTQGERKNIHRNLVAQLEDENLAPTQKGL